MPYAFTLGYQIPTEVTFGPGVVSRIGELVKQYSKKVLLVTMKDIPSLPRVIKLLEEAGCDIILFDEVAPNPVDSTINSTALIAKENGCKVIVGLGGGSSIDTAKATAVLATHPGNAWDYTVEMGRDKRPVTSSVLPVIAIPTTAGTGAEVTKNAILTNPKAKQKSPIQSIHICPKHALVDPELTITMPAGVTAATGFDAFTHAFERYLCEESFPFIEHMAEEAMRTVVRNLEKVLSKPDDMEARAAMSWASTQAGFTLLATNMGESGLHVFSLPVSAHFDVSHGEALAVVMPFVLEELSKIRPKKTAKLASILSREKDTGVGRNEKEACAFTQQAMERWFSAIHLKRRLSDYGIQERDLGKIAASINRDRLTNAWKKEFTFEEVRAYYARCL